MESSVIRTSDAHAPEMLIGAFGVIAGSTCRLKRTQGLFRVNLMAVGHGQEAAINILGVVGVIAIRLEHAKGTLIGREGRRLRLRLFFNDRYLMALAEPQRVEASLHRLLAS